MFNRRPDFQRIVQLGLFASMDYSDELDVTDGDDDYQNWEAGHSDSRRYPRRPDRSGDRGLDGTRTTTSNSDYQPPLHYYTPPLGLLSDPHPVNKQAKESDSERRARLLQEEKKSKEKAEKKRLKKQRQKERKRLEKEKQNPLQNKEGEDDAQQVKVEEGKPENNKSRNNPNSGAEQLASAKDADSSSNSSEDESSEEYSDAKSDSDDAEELDLSSAFVTKAALIAKQKLDQKPRPEKKSPAHKVHKTSPGKSNEPPISEKDVAAPTFEDNVKMSTDLANIGNRYASTGDFSTAVKYFTDAIKCNPREFKLFGNRSFCFEKMQEYEKALVDAELSLSICPGWVKGMFRKGRALAGLKRYEEASLAFREVLKLDSSCAEAAQELMRVQITQLMRYGFTREQSSNALIIHGTVEKALEVLSKLNHRPGAIQTGPRPPAQVANVTGVSPILSANTHPAPTLPQSQDAPKTQFKNNPLGSVQNMSNGQSQPKPVPNQAVNANNNGHQQELFPIWVGNLIYPVSESAISNLFSKVGTVYSLNVLTYKRCAFINYTKQEHCDEAIRRFHGHELNGNNIAVRYPDRIPHGMGISRSALKAENWQDENLRQNEYVDGRNAYGSRRPGRPYRHAPDYRGSYKR